MGRLPELVPNVRAPRPDRPRLFSRLFVVGRQFASVRFGLVLFDEARLVVVGVGFNRGRRAIGAVLEVVLVHGLV